ILALTVLRHLQQVDQPEKSRFASQLRRDIQEADRLDSFDLNLTFLHPIAMSHFYVRTHPNPHAGRNFAAADSLAKTFGERHNESLSQPRFARFDTIFHCKTWHDGGVHE